MNKSESKYFATAVRMDEAFLTLLERKDFAYITVKELCETAGVNRSTFYLHYETMADLLTESVSHMNEQFLAYMKKDSEAFMPKLENCPLDELYLITPEYLNPYLGYIEKHKRLFRTAMEKAVVLRMDKSYNGLFRHVFTPILDRYGVPQKDRSYLIAFYLHGLMAIISEWLKNNCADSVSYIIDMIQQCVKHNTEKL
ncbi:MAG: TetR/AcrR family transcriptional regulator [Lachnospiraceae bacterium]|nr:TetR/AcrR family transcriptional regulator [Lachnospiraceae bacterium]